MTKSPKKSIVAQFGLISAEVEGSQPVAAQQAPGRVSAGVIGATHRAIDDIRAERDRLQAIVDAGGGQILELDPKIIDPSPYRDRLPDEDPGAFEMFKTSFDQEGQKVPIQVRRHPKQAGRYQVIYGHRRSRAARELGKMVRALEVEMTDEELVVAQGIENAARQDLSWIERALFAAEMDAAGIKTRDIYAALNIKDEELARMRAVTRAVPIAVIEKIGRAPKIGRPRWLNLARALQEREDGAAFVEALLSKASSAGSSSDERFQRVLSALQPGEKAAAGVDVKSRDGNRLGVVSNSGKEMRITAKGPQGPDFLRFLEERLPALAESFLVRDQD
ncbi:plasmid partitioning protein RepB [Rhizobium halophytocola]|uniref:ParB family chromosome partitioning protein n=1 Tax=Rhizobium halophytocola TaxID=735519 RepID=A0ABS4E4D9_9HYPH|nr:plasmid partitioning protein RepB [Rhizobium halophytocola]MBP1852822.1 ParB family chromosome partitioning protein [Rhizobium halophytocola]